MRGFTTCIAISLLSGLLIGSASQARESDEVCEAPSTFGLSRSISRCAAVPAGRLHCESLLVRIESDWNEDAEAFEEKPGYGLIATIGNSQFVRSSREKMAVLTDYIRACQQP